MSLLSERPEGIHDYGKLEYERLINLLALSYEVGQLVRSQIYGLSAKYNKDDNTLSRAHFENSKYEMADVITQARLFCERSEWGFHELILIGEERYLDRMKELSDKVI